MRGAGARDLCVAVPVGRGEQRQTEPFAGKHKPQSKDEQRATLTTKRAKTAMQRDRNITLQKAEEAVKQATTNEAVVKIEWPTRRVLVNSKAAYTQDKDGLGGSFLPPFEGLRL